jgi:hypothetical protein
MANFNEEEQTLPFLIPPLLQSFGHFASLKNSSTLMRFIPDIPCVFGGNDPSKQSFAKDENFWLIKLIKQEYQSLLQHEARRNTRSVAHLTQHTYDERHDLDRDFEEFMPCIGTQQSTYSMASSTMCMDDNCGCGRRWTNTTSFPAQAAYIGSCQYNDETGRRLVQTFSLILMPSIHQKGNTYHRIGIAICRQQASLPGYHDPFKDANLEEVKII